ncbi:MAG: hypothetical protein GYA42_00790 [Syntrophomonadaceae bacterium]|nr:hypothetical protein [Syntrophomonadaceae bacterium]
MAMYTLQIEDKDAWLLKGLVEKYLLDLRREIARTEKREWRKDLEKEEALMVNLLEQLPK